MRLLGILLELHQELRVSMEPRFQIELGLLKLVDAERLVAIEEVLGRMGSLGQAGPSSGETSGISRGESAASKSSPASFRSSSLRSSSASRPSPFEQDLARKRQAPEPAVSTPAKQKDDGSGDGVDVPPDIVSNRVSNRVVSEDLPSREVAWVREVLRRLEEGSKPVLAPLLADPERWEFGESEVRIRLADNGIARVLPDADRRFLDRLVSEVLDRPVRVQFAEDWKGPSSPLSSPAAGRSANRSANKTSESSLEGRVRGDPEVAEFESLFGKSVTDIRRRKD